MALILQIETSTASCSVSLAENGCTLSFKELTQRNVHASHITLFIDDVMNQAGKRLEQLQAVAVSMGPGSYTGLRIGVSVAKGLCYALDIPLLALNTLKIMAAGIRNKYPSGEFLFCPMIDARRMEVYTAVYDNSLTELLPVEAKIIDNYSFQDILSGSRIVFFGDGAEKCSIYLGEKENAVLDLTHINSARHLNELALEKFNKSVFEDIAYFEPYYLKDFMISVPKPRI